MLRHALTTRVVLLSALAVVGWIGTERALARQADLEPVVMSLRPLLKASGKAARVYYAATCQDGDPLWIPRLDIQEPPPGQTGSAAVRAMFQSNRNVVVAEEPTGIIRIRIGEFPDEVLQTRISHLSLDPLEQYDAAVAVDALHANEDMAAAVKRLGLTETLHIYSSRIVFPAPGLPHMPPSMSDVTADQVLDTIATSFNGIVLYGICTQSRTFIVDVLH